jgi:hypothetical protein
MAAGAVSSARDPQHNVRWKWLLLALCALTALWILVFAIDNIGFRGAPWYGYWDAGWAPRPPYSAAFSDVQPGGAAAAADIRDGDVLDLREQSRDERERIASGTVMTTQPEILITRRGPSKFTRRLYGSTLFDGDAKSKLAAFIPLLVGSVWFLGIAFVVAARRAWLPEARWLTLILLCWASPPATYIAVPSASLSLAFSVAGAITAYLTLLLLVGFSATFGRQTPLRRILEAVSYTVIGFNVAYYLFSRFEILTPHFDVFKWSQLPLTLFPLPVVVLAVLAILNTPSSERARATWLLLPIPTVFLLGQILNAGSLFLFPLSSSAGFYAQGLAQIASITAALAVTYALLNRRVLDLGFVLSRTLVVSIVGLIVVVAFVLLEWVLGSVLTGVSHASGLIANAALALVIGVSLNYIHKHVDRSVDLVLFRKRHEDERALLAFSKEAAYITEWDALLDATLEKVRRHTDARSASVLIGANGFYSAVRSFGDNTVVSVNENDEAILALKVWHKPIDPHHHQTTLNAALALPMLARGKLYGVLLLGERTGGEAYAPDEVEALSQLANGVGSALEALLLTRDGSAAVLAERIELAIASLREAMVSEIRSLRSTLPT